MAFKPTTEWLEAAKQKPVSYNTVLFICGLMSEELPKSSKYKYFNQLRANHFECFKRYYLQTHREKRYFSQEWLMIGLKKIKIFFQKTQVA